MVEALLVVAAALAGAGLGAVFVAVRTVRRQTALDTADPPTTVQAATAAVTAAATPASAAATLVDLPRRTLEVLRVGAVVLDASDGVVYANPAARSMGVVRIGRLAVEPLMGLARESRRDGEPRDAEFDLPPGRLGREPAAVRARVTPLDLGHVALLVEDVTESHRVEAVRRDFVANVGHELKTPVGALALLAEALFDASDDPAAVRRFAARVVHESERLSKLVQEVIELSRLQGAEPLPEPEAVPLERVVAEAVDRTRLAAQNRSITIVSGGDRGLAVHGSEAQLVTALANLVDNAIAYSPEGTKVAIGMRRRDRDVEVSVSDQGIGIAERDLERVFERFYRADPARSRATGGTGLGLAIVKHIATNHGGTVSVWSVEGSGSTFTLRLPAARSEVTDVPEGGPARIGVGPESGRTSKEAPAVREVTARTSVRGRAS